MNYLIIPPHLFKKKNICDLSIMRKDTSLFVQLGKNVPQSGSVVDPFDDAALLIEGNHSICADM